MRAVLTTPVEELGRMGREGRRRIEKWHDARIETARLASWLGHAPDRQADESKAEEMISEADTLVASSIG